MKDSQRRLLVDFKASFLLHLLLQLLQLLLLQWDVAIHQSLIEFYLLLGPKLQGQPQRLAVAAELQLLHHHRSSRSSISSSSSRDRAV